MSLSSRTSALAAALFLLTLALYFRVAHNDFIAIDDPGYLQNRWVARGLSWDGVVWAFTREHSSNWHPLTWLSHMLDVELFGTDPMGPHLVNAGLHALNTALLFLFLQGTTARPGPSGLAALLFAVHPQRVESVAWVAERKDVLSAAFFFATLLAHARYARRPSGRRLALVCLLGALGLMAKPMLVTLPCVLLLVDLWPLGRWRPGEPGLGRLVREKLPLLGLSVGSIVVTLVAQRDAMQDLELLPLGVRLANALDSWGLYVAKFLWPTDLAIFYPHPALTSPVPVSPWGLATLAIGAGLVVASLLAWRARRSASTAWVTTGWFWYVGMLVPVIGIVQVGGQQIADRYAYLPQTGLILLVVFGLDATVTGAGARRALATAGLLVAALAARVTWSQIAVWRNSETLLRHALAVTERNAPAHANLGLYYLERNELGPAIEQFEARLALVPSAGILVNLGVARLRNGEAEAARRAFEEALRLDPRHVQAHANLAALLLARGDAAGAVAHYEAALKQRPRAQDLREGLERARAAARAERP